ncbi:hypothetical protein HK101_004907 [Irineochytrium annulatum]|nr:hypothetical protein HK101_004907 [Irineochytrium annulatum]
MSQSQKNRSGTDYGHKIIPDTERRINAATLSEMDVIGLVLRDHNLLREVKMMYNKAKDEGDMEEAKKLFKKMLMEVTRHSVTEEILLYPMLEELSGEGKEQADKSRGDHDTVTELLEEASSETDPEALDSKMATIIRELEEHMEKEETLDLVFLQSRTTLQMREEVGRKYIKNKSIAPEKSLPDAPEMEETLEAAVKLLKAPNSKFEKIFLED